MIRILGSMLGGSDSTFEGQFCWSGFGPMFDSLVLSALWAPSW